MSDGREERKEQETRIEQEKPKESPRSGSMTMTMDEWGTRAGGLVVRAPRLMHLRVMDRLKKQPRAHYRGHQRNRTGDGPRIPQRGRTE